MKEYVTQYEKAASEHWIEVKSVILKTDRIKPNRLNFQISMQGFSNIITIDIKMAVLWLNTSLWCWKDTPASFVQHQDLL